MKRWNDIHVYDVPHRREFKEKCYGLGWNMGDAIRWMISEVLAGNIVLEKKEEEE